MDQPHYDVDSLAYMSTDIVLADVSARPDHKYTATVTGILYGSLQVGEKLDKLSDFLQFFWPMEDGQRVVLFLDRRPRPANFDYPEASKSPFAVPTSGVYLVDAHQHIHEYYQFMNPGPYVAEGYGYIPKRTDPTQEQDLAFPSLEIVEARIAASLKWVQTLRPLLDKTAGRNDVPELLKLLYARSGSGDVCFHFAPDAIVERIAYHLRSLNDPELLLRIYPTHAINELTFLSPVDGRREQDFAASRVNYLIETFSDTKMAVPLRVAAVEILLRLSMFHAGSRPGPWKSFADNPWLATRESEIRKEARSIFDSKSQDARLRARCLGFLFTDEPKIQAHIRKVYAASRSEELRFAIEESFLNVSDELYQSLNLRGGPPTSIVRARTESGCPPASAGKVLFFAVYHQRHDSLNPFSPAVQTRSFVLTDERTGRRAVLDGIRQAWNSGTSGEDWIEFDQPTNLAAGSYSLTLEFSSVGKWVSSGYGLELSVRETSQGRKITLNEANRKH